MPQTTGSTTSIGSRLGQSTQPPPPVPLSDPVSITVDFSTGLARWRSKGGWYDSVLDALTQRTPPEREKRLGVELVVPRRFPNPGYDLQKRWQGALVGWHAAGDVHSRPFYARLQSDAAPDAAWVRWVYTSAWGASHAPASAAVPRPGLSRPFAVGLYSDATGWVTHRTLGGYYFPTAPDEKKGFPPGSQIRVEVVIADDATPDDMSSDERVMARGAAAHWASGVAREAAAAASDRRDDPSAHYLLNADRTVLVRWEFLSPPDEHPLPADLLIRGWSGQPGRVSVHLLSTNLGSGGPAERSAASDRLAFGELSFPPAAVAELEALLTPDRPPHDLAVLLNALGRTLAAHPDRLWRPDERVRALVGHPDPRVHWLAKALVDRTMAGRGEQGAEPGLDGLVPPPADYEVPLNDLPPAQEGKRKQGRPVQTSRRLNAERFLTETLQAFEADLDRDHQAVVGRFGTLLSRLAGHAAATFEENRNIAAAVMMVARRYGVDLILEKEGVRHSVHVYCKKQGTTGPGIFAVRTHYGNQQLGQLAAWPLLTACTSEPKRDESA